MTGAAAAVRTTRSGNQILVGYVATGPGVRRQGGGRPPPRHAARRRSCRGSSLVDTLPTRTSGKIDRDALPWPLRPASARGAAPKLDGTAAWVHRAVAGHPRGGGRRPRRRLLRPRRRQPHRGPAGVAPAVALPRGHRRRHLRDAHPRRAGGRARRHGRARRRRRTARSRRSRSRRSSDRSSSPCRCAPWPGCAGWCGSRPAQPGRRAAWGLDWLPASSWWLVGVGWLLLVSPPGRMAVAAVGARLLLRGRRGRAPTRAAAGRTCGSGSPSASPTRPASSTSPARPR